MPVTVRYPLDFTCGFPTGCAYDYDAPLVGYAPTFQHTHLDAVSPNGPIGGGGDDVQCALRQMIGTSMTSIFIQANVPTGTTDGTGTSTLIMGAETTSVRIHWFFIGNSTTPTHYTGYTDVTYGDVEPPPLTQPPQMVTILG